MTDDDCPFRFCHFVAGSFAPCVAFIFSPHLPFRRYRQPLHSTHSIVVANGQPIQSHVIRTTTRARSNGTDGLVGLLEFSDLPVFVLIYCPCVSYIVDQMEVIRFSYTTSALTLRKLSCTVSLDLSALSLKSISR